MCSAQLTNSRSANCPECVDLVELRGFWPISAQHRATIPEARRAGSATATVTRQIAYQIIQILSQTCLIDPAVFTVCSLIICALLLPNHPLKQQLGQWMYIGHACICAGPCRHPRALCSDNCCLQDRVFEHMKQCYTVVLKDTHPHGADTIPQVRSDL
ncbi:hypothetical protein INR49_015569 [Caranx melampygus]|nr:hypothetical protein INR49_015569 [Caranx melampygus]